MDNEQEEDKKKKEIEIVNGDGKDLNISPVYNHIKIDKPDNTTDKNQKIVVPKSKKDND